MLGCQTRKGKCEKKICPPALFIDCRLLDSKKPQNFTFSTMSNSETNIGVPLKLLLEAESHKVTVEVSIRPSKYRPSKN